MLLFMSGKPQVGQRLARVLGGDATEVAIVTASRIAQANNVLRARPPQLLILDMTAPCEIDPEFVIARFMPMARGGPPLLIFTRATEHATIKHYGEIPGVHVIPFPATDLLLRAIVKEYLP
jgi:DNA-binding response OmpR family regulator